MPPTWRARHSASDDYPYPPEDDEDEDDGEEDWDEEDEDDDEEEPEWQVVGAMSKDSTPRFSANSRA